MVRIASLAPDIIAGLLDGHYADLTSSRLMADTRLLLDWKKQRETLRLA